MLCLKLYIVYHLIELCYLDVVSSFLQIHESDFRNLRATQFEAVRSYDSGLTSKYVAAKLQKKATIRPFLVRRISFFYSGEENHL